MNERVRSTPPISTATGRAARRTIEQNRAGRVPATADFAMVFVVAGRSVVGIASAHVSPGGERLLRALRRVYRYAGRTFTAPSRRSSGRDARRFAGIS